MTEWSPVTVLAVSAAVVAGLIWVALSVRIGLVAARMLQIEEYEVVRLRRWGRDRAWLAHRSALSGGGIAVAAGVATLAVRASAVGGGGAGLAGWAGGGREAAATVAALGWVAAGIVGHLTWRWLPPKKGLVFTARLRRLLGIALTLVVGLAALAVGLLLAGPVGWGPGPGLVAVVAVVLVAGGCTAIPLLVLATAAVIARPVEGRVRAVYLARARRRLRQIDPVVLAVTGSYGKTTTKHILAHLLGGYGETLATPKSFNTLMGVCRAINESLAPSHRTFLVEMDAYGPGEVAAICHLVQPRHAVLTAVGPAHLERFASVGDIGAALYEAVAALPTDGVAVMYAGSADSAVLAQRAVAEGRRIVRYGAAGEPGVFDVVAGDIRCRPDGVQFTWEWAAEGLRHEVFVPLLGRHQALNVSAALALVHILGHPLEAALGRIVGLTPVEHRLQPLPGSGGVIVIDDAFNANPVGVHNALEVLAEIGAGAKILVTPGIVELGSLEEAENRRYGEHAAGVCDHVIVMDSRTGRLVLEGLHSGGLGDDRIHVAETLAQATALIGRLARAGDVVLFANDLPDTYLPTP